MLGPSKTVLWNPPSFVRKDVRINVNFDVSLARSLGSTRAFVVVHIWTVSLRNRWFRFTNVLLAVKVTNIFKLLIIEMDRSQCALQEIVLQNSHSVPSIARKLTPPTSYGNVME